MTDAVPWLWILGGAALLLVGLFALGVGLFGDRSRGRKRCTKCFYVLDGLPEARCPECGWSATNLRHLFRNRRRWRLVFAGIALAAIGSASASWKFVVAKNPWMHVPHRVLGWCMPWAPSMSAKNQSLLLDAYLPWATQISVREYHRIIDSYIGLMQRPENWTFCNRLDYRLSGLLSAA